jgi:hypothetical protein
MVCVDDFQNFASMNNALREQNSAPSAEQSRQEAAKCCAK